MCELKCLIFATVLLVIVIIIIFVIYYLYKLNSRSPKLIEYGVVDSIEHNLTTGSIMYGISNEIQLKKSFTTVPQIIFNTKHDMDGFISASAIDITTTKFKAIVFASTVGTTVELNWTASQW